MAQETWVSTICKEFIYVYCAGHSTCHSCSIESLKYFFSFEKYKKIISYPKTMTKFEVFKLGHFIKYKPLISEELFTNKAK